MLVPKAEIDPSLYLKIVIILIGFSFYVSLAVIFFSRIFWPLWIELGSPLLQKGMSLMEGQKENKPFRRMPRRYKRVRLHELDTAAHYRKDRTADGRDLLYMPSPIRPNPLDEPD